MLKNTGITIALAMLSMVGALGIDAYLPSFPAIIQDFQATPLAVQQTLSIYVGAMAITTLFAGTLSDSFGRRPTVIVSLLLFTAGSALAIFAKDIQVLLLARGLQGVAAGFGHHFYSFIRSHFIYHYLWFRFINDFTISHDFINEKRFYHFTFISNAVIKGCQLQKIETRCISIR